MTRPFVLATRFTATLVGVSLAFGLGCAVDYAEDPPPSLADAPAVDQDDELVFERSLRWWSPPTSQRAQLYRRDDGTWLLRRDRWDGTAVYAWAEGTLTDAGEQRLADALAAVDTDKPGPAPGEYGCTYVDSLEATVFVDGEGFDYLGLCPPEGLVELTGLYEELVELLLDCPLDPSWYVGELPLEQVDCAVVD